MHSSSPFPPSLRHAQGGPPPAPATPAPAAWFTALAFMPVPFILLLYGIDGLILPCLYFGGEHLPFAIGTSAIAGLFLAGAAHDRGEARRGLRVTAVITNLLYAAAAFSLMFGLYQ